MDQRCVPRARGLQKKVAIDYILRWPASSLGFLVLLGRTVVLHLCINEQLKPNRT
jgi:hypothetical protein